MFVLTINHPTDNYSHWATNVFQMVYIFILLHFCEEGYLLAVDLQRYVDMMFGTASVVKGMKM